MNYLRLSFSPELITMKILSLLVMYLSLSGLLSAQNVAFAPDKNNICYLGVDNPLTIVAENCSCNQLVLKSDNGTIKGKSCQYIYHPKNIGKVLIQAYKKQEKKLIEIGVTEFRVKRVPDPVFKIGPVGGHDGDVNSIFLCTTKYARADLENFDFDARFKIDSFRVVIISTDSSSSNAFINHGSLINDEIHSAFVKLKIGDKIIFDNIKVKGPDEIERELTPLKLKATTIGSGEYIIYDKHED